MGRLAVASHNGVQLTQPSAQAPRVQLATVQLLVHLGKRLEQQLLLIPRQGAVVEAQVRRSFNVRQLGVKQIQRYVRANHVHLQQQRVVQVTLPNQAEHIPITRQDVELLQLQEFNARSIVASKLQLLLLLG